VTIILTTLHTCEGERQDLLDLNTIDGKSWPEIARLPRYSGIPFTSLYMFAKGKRPLADEWLDKLGIPHEKPAPVCTNQSCEGYGEPHVFDCRTQQVKSKSKPRSRPVRWGWLWDMPQDELRLAMENKYIVK